MGMEQVVVDAVGYSDGCQDCGAQAQWCGVQVLDGGRLRWDTECSCPACGFELAVCGGVLPAAIRDRLLAEHGPARLRVGPGARNAEVMRVLRAVLGVGLDGVGALLGEVLAGTHSGTLPEMELLARRLRASGIDAVAERARPS